jgi:hypothetical protein
MRAPAGVLWPDRLYPAALLGDAEATGAAGRPDPGVTVPGLRSEAPAGGLGR